MVSSANTCGHEHGSHDGSHANSPHDPPVCFSNRISAIVCFFAVRILHQVHIDGRVFTIPNVLSVWRRNSSAVALKVLGSAVCLCESDFGGDDIAVPSVHEI